MCEALDSTPRVPQSVPSLQALKAERGKGLEHREEAERTAALHHSQRAGQLQQATSSLQMWGPVFWALLDTKEHSAHICTSNKTLCLPQMGN